MTDTPSILMFLAVVAAMTVLTPWLVLKVLGRLSLRRAVPLLGLLAPVMILLGGLAGVWLMVLSGHDVGYVIVLVVAVSAAVGLVARRVARPLTSDLAEIEEALRAVESGQRIAPNAPVRSDEVGAVADRVRDLARSLARAEQERDAAEDERRRVVEAISHDLRTPLSALIASIESLEDGYGDPVAHRDAMRANVDALRHLIDDMFLLARIEAADGHAAAEVVDLAELVDETVDELTPVARRSGVDIAAPGGPVLVLADPNSLGRVLRNLVGNAIRYAPGGTSVTVHFEELDGQVATTVADAGPGFPSGFERLAFERFSRADASRDRASGGTGLGLAIAQGLVHAQGGRIWADPGPGGRVTFTLPMEDFGRAQTQQVRVSAPRT